MYCFDIFVLTEKKIKIVLKRNHFQVKAHAHYSDTSQNINAHLKNP